MKKTVYPLMVALLCYTFAQAQQPVFKTSVQQPAGQKTTVPIKQLRPEVAPAKAPPPVNTDISSASVSFITGDDGKDHDTQIGMAVWDKNHRAAADYNMVNGNFANTVASNAAEYFTGSTVTVPMQVQLSVPTGEIKQVGALPLPVLRLATASDFNGGGEIRLNIIPVGHDTWKIRTVTLHLNFNNDRNSPHEITWNNITLSQDSRYADLLFDKDFNAVQ